MCIERPCQKRGELQPCSDATPLYAIVKKEKGRVERQLFVAELDRKGEAGEPYLTTEFSRRRKRYPSRIQRFAERKRDEETIKWIFL